MTRRTWIVSGVVAGMLAIAGAATAATGGRSDPPADPTSTALTFASENGASCTVEIRPVVHATDLAAHSIVRGYLAKGEAPAVNLMALSTGGAVGDREVAALAQTLSRGAEAEILRWFGSHIDVTFLLDYTCAGGPPPDVVGFFQASTGQTCEIRLAVDPDSANGASDDDGAIAARAYLASVDFTQVDYSAALRDLADFWPDDHDPGLAEAEALAQTVIRRAHSAFDTMNPAWLPIIITSSTHCDAGPSEGG